MANSFLDLANLPDCFKVKINIPEVHTKKVDTDKEGKFGRKTVSLIVTSDFKFNIKANYSSGGFFKSAFGVVNTWLSQVGYGLGSMRSSVLTYQGSDITGFTLDFIIVDIEGSDIVLNTLDTLYRTVLPTFADNSSSGSTSFISSITNAGIGEKVISTLDDKEKDSGVIVSKVSSALKSADEYLGVVNEKYLGLYSFEAPLSYDPSNLLEVGKQTVGVTIGEDYFSCFNELVVTDLNVTLSKELVEVNELGGSDTNNSKAPLYATGQITFSFIRPVSQVKFRDFFGKRGRVGYTEVGDIASEGQNITQSGTGPGENLTGTPVPIN